MRTAFLMTILSVGIFFSSNYSGALAGNTFDTIKEQGVVRCGSIQIAPGTSDLGETGSWQGFFPDFCRAIATAVTGHVDGAEFIETDNVNRFSALRSGNFDVLVTNATWTLSRDTSLGISFPGTLYYDGQGFMAFKSLGAKKLTDLQKASVCVSKGTTTIRNLSDFVKKHKMDWNILPFDSSEGRIDNFYNHHCDLISGDHLLLASVRANPNQDQNALIIFPDVISKEPLGPAVRNDDIEWFNAIRWILFALFTAEEKGITSANVDAMKQSDDPEVRNLLGVDPGISEALGLDNEWAYRVIRDVGNYGELFERHLGPNTAFNLQRGLNALWANGGLMYAPPFK